MNRFIIVGLIEGDTAKFHQQLVRTVAKLFKVPFVLNAQLPTHITFKEEFPVTKPDILIKALTDFCAKNPAMRVEYRGYDHFERDVIFMDAKLWVSANATYVELLEMLRGLKGLAWSPHDGEGRHFHTTVAMHDIKERYDEITAFLKLHPCKRDAIIERIAIIKEGNPWTVFKTFDLEG